MAEQKKDKLYVKRYKTLKEHRAAVAARKTLKGGKNVGPVANAAAYGETMKKKKPVAKKPVAKKPVAKKPAAKPKKKTGSFFAGAEGGKFDNKQRASERFFAGAKGGKYDKKKPSKTQKPRKNRRGSGMRSRDYKLF
mgnify:CR=1 FL=1|jgi:hypothetical protein|tara:strand:+ start:243 stop:653 length:411 start_codon:yes stop_codon:yes gene_type:complete